jgi:hypothetical protein
VKLEEQYHSLLGVIVGLNLSRPQFLNVIEELGNSKQLTIRLGKMVQMEDLRIVPGI